MTVPRPRTRQPKQLDAGMLQAEINSFALRLAAEGKAAKTIRTYTEAVQWFAATGPPRRADQGSWEQVTRHDIQQWMVWLLDRYSAAYASNQYRALQQFFKWLAARTSCLTRWRGWRRRASRPDWSRSSPLENYQGWNGRARAATSRSGAIPPSSRCSPRPASGCPS